MACNALASAWYDRARWKWCAELLSQALTLLLCHSGAGEGGAAALCAAAPARVHSLPRGERPLRCTFKSKHFIDTMFSVTPEA